MSGGHGRDRGTWNILGSNGKVEIFYMWVLGRGSNN